MIRGLAWSAANHGYEGQVKELERNPVFKEVVRKYPENCYTHWKHVMKRADEEKVKAASKLEQMKKAGDLSSLIGYVVNGNNNLSMIHQNRPEDIMVRHELNCPRNRKTADDRQRGEHASIVCRFSFYQKY